MTKLIGGSPSQVPTNSQLSRSAFIEPEDLPVPQSVATELEGKESNIAPGTPDQYWSGDKAWTDFREAVLNTGTGYPEIRPVFNANFLMAGQLDPRVTFSRPGKSWRIVNGVLREYDVNEPVLTPDGWSLRPAETNLVPDFPSWTSGSSSFSTEDPDDPVVNGPLYRITASPGVSSGSALRTRYVNFTSTKNTFTIKAKKGNTTSVSFVIRGGSFSQAFFSFDAGEFITVDPGLTAKYRRMANGVFELSITRTDASIPASGTSYLQVRIPTPGISTGSEYILISSPQFNAGDPIPYIPTTTGAVTRSADNASIQGAAFAEIWNPQEGAIVLDASLAWIDGFPRFFQLRSSSTEFSVLINLDGKLYTYSNSITTTIDASNWSGVPVKIGLGWSGGKISVWLNGIKKITDLSTASDFSTFTQMLIVQANAAAYKGAFQGRRLRIFNQRPTDAQMEAMTS